MSKWIFVWGWGGGNGWLNVVVVLDWGEGARGARGVDEEENVGF